jgi:hypothetical protein
MSLNQVPLQTVREVPQVVDVSRLDKREYSILSGSQTISYVEYLAQNVNDQSIQVSSYIPSLTTIIDPNEIKAKVKFRLTFAGTSTSGNLIQLGSTDAPKAFPLSQATSTLSATVNGQTISALLGQYFDACIRYGQDGLVMDNDYGTTPTQLDKCTNYENLFGLNESPMAAFGTSFVASRGGFSGITVVSNTPTAAVIDLEIMENIFLPLFKFNNKGLVNIQTINYVWTFFSPLISKLWSHDAVNGNNITSSSASILNFSIVYRFITPQILSSVPKTSIYSYYNLIPNNQSYGSAVAAGSQVSISLSPINLQSIPKAFWLFMRHQDSDITISTPNTYFRIDNVNCTYLNVTSILASAKTQNLYAIAKDNGYKGDWDMWNRYNGSVLKLLVGKDLGIDSLSAPGLQVQNQFSAVVSATNISNASITPMLFCFIEYEGTANIGNNSMQLSTSVLSSSDVLNAQLANAQIMHSPKVDNFYGAGLIDDAMTFGKDLWQTGKSGVKLASEVAPLIGLGNGGAYSAGSVVGGRRKKRGGQMIDRNELNEQMEQYSEY